MYFVQRKVVEDEEVLNSTELLQKPKFVFVFTKGPILLDDDGVEPPKGDGDCDKTDGAVKRLAFAVVPAHQNHRAGRG